MVPTTILRTYYRITCLSLAFLLAALFFGCATTKKDVTLFYMGENALQYFFPAKNWEREDETLRIEPDFLYRTYALEGDEKSHTVINFSFYAEGGLFRKRPELLRLKSSGVLLEIEPKRIEQIYIDQGKARYSTWVSSADFYRLMEGATESGMVEIILKIGGEELRFLSPESFSDHIVYFQEVLL